MSKLDELKEFFTRRGYVYTWHPSGDEDDRNCQDEVHALLAEAQRLNTAHRVAKAIADGRGARIAELEAENAKLRAVYDTYMEWTEVPSGDAAWFLPEDYAPFSEAIAALRAGG